MNYASYWSFRSDYLIKRLLCVVMFFFLFTLLIPTQPTARAAESASAPSRNALIDLVHGWEYVAGDASENTSTDKKWIKIEDFTKLRILVQDKEQPIHSFRIRLPETGCQKCSLSFDHYIISYKAYLDGEFILENAWGTIDITALQSRPPLTITLPQDSAGKTLLIVTDQTHNSYPIYLPVYFGEEQLIYDKLWSEEKASLLIGLFILLIGAISLILYFSLARDRSFLDLANCAVIIGIYMLSSASTITLYVDFPLFWKSAEYLTLYLMLIFVWMYFRNFAKVDKKADIIIFGTNGSLTCISIAGLLYGVPVYDWQSIQNIIFITTGAYALWKLFKSSRDGDRDARLVLYSFSLLSVITILNVILVQFFQSFISISVYCGGFFMASQLFVMTYRFRRMNEELRLRSENLQTINIRLTEMNKLKDSILSNTSHEMRTPLNGIIGLAESMVDLPPNIKIDYNGNLKTIIFSARRLQALVNDILDFSDLRNRKIKIQPIPIVVKNHVVREIEDLKPLFPSKPVKLYQIIPDDLPAVMADEVRLHQMLNHLIGNAMKFTSDGEVVIDATSLNGFVQIKIKDTGIGITTEQMPRIFELFEQGDGSAERNYGGTGIGLAVVKVLSELHGGSITCTSEPGRGSEFILSLPIANDDM